MKHQSHRLILFFILNRKIKYRQVPILVPLVLFALLCPVNHAAFAQAPESALFYVRMDQNYNVVRRLRPRGDSVYSSYDGDSLSAPLMSDSVLSEEQKRPRWVHLVESDADQIEVLSDYALDDELRRVTSPSGKRLVPIFEEDFHRDARQNRSVARVLAHRLLGNNSWYLEPSPNGYGGVFFKIVSGIPFYKDKAARGVQATDYLLSGMQNMPPEFQDSAIPEFLMVELKRGPLSTNYIVAYRSASVIQKKWSRGRVYPLHGLLGCEDCVARLARAAGISAKQWKLKVLIPLIARYTAYSHLVLGALGENHTQNLLGLFDEDTGAFLKLFTRDNADTLLNPIVRLGQVSPAGYMAWDKASILNIANYSWIERANQEFKYIGYNTSVFTGQAVDSHVNSFQTRLLYNVEFIFYYKQTVEEIIGETLDFSSESMNVIESMRMAQRSEEIYTASYTARGIRRRAVAFVIDEIYNKAFAIYSKNQILPRIDFGVTQTTASAEFERYLMQGRVAFRSMEDSELLLPRAQRTWLGAQVQGHLGIRLPIIGERNIGSHIFYGIVLNQIVVVNLADQSVLASTFTRPWPAAARRSTCSDLFGI